MTDDRNDETEPKPRPLKVVLDSEENKIRVIRNAKKSHWSSQTVSRSVKSGFCMGPNATLYALSMGKKPQNCPSHCDFVSLPEEDRQTAIDNVHTNVVKIVHVVLQISSSSSSADIIADRQLGINTDIFITILHNCSHWRSTSINIRTQFR